MIRAAAAPHPGSGGSSFAGNKAQVEHAIRATHVILANVGVEMSPCRVKRLVRDFTTRVQRNGYSYIDFLTNSLQLTAPQRRRVLADPAAACLLPYRDPTGETAARHVDNERSAAP
jgi:hypothetical protein